MDVETPLPGLEEEQEIEVVDGDGIVQGEGETGMPAAGAEDAQANFMQALSEIMAQLTEPCQKEFSAAMQGQRMDAMSEDCKVEFSKAASTIPNFNKLQSDAIQKQADVVRRTNGRQPDPNTKYYLSGALVVLFAMMVAYIIYVNKKLKQAGLLDRKNKPLSKKKLEKEKMKSQRKKA